MGSSPRVSVLVLNFNGREHLRTCLPTVEAQTFPRDEFRIEVVDNGSTDGSAEFVATHHPNVAVTRLGRNVGFSVAYNRSVQQATTEFVVFLNNDTRVEPTWLAELMSAAERCDAQCVGSKILDWDGSRIDFVGGIVSFVGHAWQRDSGAPVGKDYGEDPLIFACGGSMLISRAAFLDAGGFDEDFFAYLEDVDLGWRLALRGHRTILAPRAITYHRLHGTYSHIAFAQRLRLFERNALAMIYKNYADETLKRVLPAAVSLSLLRGLSQSGIDPQLFALGKTPPPNFDLSARAVVHLLALEDFACQIPELDRKRRVIQDRRRVPEEDIIALFGEPFRLHASGRYEEIAQQLIDDFKIRPLFAAGGTARTARPAAETAVRLPEHDQIAASGRGSAPDDDLPTVSVVILTAIGPTFLPDCLSALRAQTYPADRCEVIVVDNASADDPTPVAQRFYPGVRVLRNATNIGFGPANNVGARAASGDYIAFLNDDTRPHPDWLREMVGTARRRGAASVASRMQSWDGTTIDFVGGVVNCEGKGFQLDYGVSEDGRYMDERPVLFACGGAMLVRKDLFLETDGWDERTFMYYEDLELGWRLWMFGYEVWFSPRAIVYHKHHGTTDRWAVPPRLRLYERNSLRILYTLLERENLQRALPAALLLAVDRALLATELSRAGEASQPSASVGPTRGTAAPRVRLRERLKAVLRARGVSRNRSFFQNLRLIGVGGLLGAAGQLSREVSPLAGSRRTAYQIERGAAPLEVDGRHESIAVVSAAILSALQGFLDAIPELSGRRQRFEALRRRPDREILGPFDTHWLDPLPAPHQAAHNAVQRALVQSLGLEAIVRAPARAETEARDAAATSGRIAS